MKLINIERDMNSMVAVYQNEDSIKVFCWFDDDVMLSGPIQEIEDVEIIKLFSKEKVANTFVDEVGEDVPYAILGNVIHTYLDPFHRKCKWIDIVKLITAFSDHHYLEELTLAQVYKDRTGKTKRSLFREDESTPHGKIMYCLQELDVVKDFVDHYSQFM